MASILDTLAQTFIAVLGDDELATYTRADGSWSGPVAVIFENPSSLMATGAGPDAVVAEAKFHIAVGDLFGGWGQGDTIAFRGKTWIVRAPLPDGHGMVQFQVEAAA
jgi:hypothetical protein